MTATEAAPSEVVRPGGEARAQHGASVPSEAHAPQRGASTRSRAARLRGAALLGLGLALAVALSLALGARATDLATVVTALTDPGALADPADAVAVRDLRVPRTVIGLIVGAALGLAGVVMQGVTRNPVADPGLLGVTAGASFAVVLGIALAGETGVIGLAVWALAGALVTSLGVGALARAAGDRATPALLVVVGFAVTAGLGTLTTLVLLGDPAALDRYRFWTVGSLTGRDLDAALTLLPLVMAGIVVAALLARPLDALALGDDVARGLGFRLGAVRGGSLVAIVLLAGTATALAGPLVFVGLLGAHAARAAVGGHHGLLMPVSAVAGAAFVLVADIIGRLVAPPGELEVGIVIAALGAPLLIALVRARRAVAA